MSGDENSQSSVNYPYTDDQQLHVSRDSFPLCLQGVCRYRLISRSLATFSTRHCLQWTFSTTHQLSLTILFWRQFRHEYPPTIQHLGKYLFYRVAWNRSKFQKKVPTHRFQAIWRRAKSKPGGSVWLQGQYILPQARWLQPATETADELIAGGSCLAERVVCDGGIQQHLRVVAVQFRGQSREVTEVTGLSVQPHLVLQTGAAWRGWGATRCVLTAGGGSTVTHRRRNGRGHGAIVPSLFGQNCSWNLLLLSLTQFLYRKWFTRTRRARICVEMHRKGVSFCSRWDLSFTGPLTFAVVPTPLLSCDKNNSVWK